MRALTICVLFGSSHAFPTFPSSIPNGLSVPCPSHLTTEEAAEQCEFGSCTGVGHADCRGGNHKGADGSIFNAFGEAFISAGLAWTTELCNADSDGDGATNGQELGDPCCVWSPGMASPVDEAYQISHPGHAEDTTESAMPSEAECVALQEELGVAGPFNVTQFVDSLFNPGEERRELTYQVNNHTLLPNETVYTGVFFPIPQNETLYVVGFMATIDNKVRNHHFVALFCSEEISAYTDEPPGTPIQPTEETNGAGEPGCTAVEYVWAPGGDYVRLPPDVAIKFGKDSGYQTLYLQVHYNNVDGVTDETDASSFTAFATTTPREHEGTHYWAGSIVRVGTIAPNTNYYNAAQCAVQLKPECEKITVASHMPHAHTAGRVLWTERYSADATGTLQLMSEVAREPEFRYDNQVTYLLDERVDVYDGDVLSTVCLFNTDGRTDDTLGGLASREEMCLHSLLVYPAQCLHNFQCSGPVASGTVDGIDSNASSIEVYNVGGWPNYAVAADGGVTQCNETLTGLELDLEASDAVYDDGAWLTISQQCPGLLDEAFLSPEAMAAYECPSSCVEHFLNLGVCFETTLEEVSNAWLDAAGSTPVDSIPMSCMSALAQRTGGTALPADAPAEAPAEAARSTPGPNSEPVDSGSGGRGAAVPEADSAVRPAATSLLLLSTAFAALCWIIGN